MSEDLLIELIRREDLPVAYNLLYKLAQYEELEMAMTATVTDLESLMFGDLPCLYGVIAWCADEPLGIATWFYNASTFMGRKGLFIEDIFVLPEHRKQGIGTQLFEYLVKYADGQKCSFIDWAALKWNKQALAFYTKMGAQVREEWCLLRLHK